MDNHVRVKEIVEKYNISESEITIRMDGRIEWICQHGIGHTKWYPKGSSSSHGCDGCCKKLRKNKEEAKNEQARRKNN